MPLVPDASVEDSERARKRALVDARHGPDPIVDEIRKHLPSGASIYEYGTGGGRNAIPLAMAGYDVRAQDYDAEHVLELREEIRKMNAELPMGERIRLHVDPAGDANVHVPEASYDAFLCIRVLHFLGDLEDGKKVRNIENAWAMIRKMQQYTKPGGLNAINFFTKETKHMEGAFFPTVGEMKQAYAGWEVLFEPPAKVSPPSEHSNWREMHQQSILFRKPHPAASGLAEHASDPVAKIG